MVVRELLDCECIFSQGVDPSDWTRHKTGCPYRIQLLINLQKNPREVQLRAGKPQPDEGINGEEETC